MPVNQRRRRTQPLFDGSAWRSRVAQFAEWLRYPKSQRQVFEISKEAKLRQFLFNSDKFICSSADDYSFLAETVLPTLLPGLVMLQEKLETSGAARGQAISIGAPPFNAIRWLAEYLSRHHPKDGVFTHESAYSTHLGKAAKILQEQRLEREHIALDKKEKEKEEKRQRELERIRAEEQSKRELEELRTRALEATMNERNRKGEKAAMDAIGIEKASLILAFRNQCMNLLPSQFGEAIDSAEIDCALFREACKMLVLNSPASFAAAVNLVDSDTIHYHTAATKVEFPVDEDEDEEQQGAREMLPPEITTKELPPLSDESAAYILKRGSGVSWTVIDGMTPKLILDTKYTENMVFFDGEKRKGTFLAVHLMRENRVAGMLCADTLDSTTGEELSEADLKMFLAVSVVLSECLDKAAWLLMDAKRQMFTERLRLLACDPSTLPEQMCVAVVDAIDGIAPGCLVSVGMMDSAMTLRLVHRSKSDNTKESNKVVTVKDKGKDIPAIFQCFQIKATSSTKNERREIDSFTVPVVDEDKMVSAAIYVANDHIRNRLADKETLEFVEKAAQLVAPVLLTPAKAAIRSSRILARSSTGDSTSVLELATLLCQRHTGAIDVLIGMAHGQDHLRIVKCTEGWYASGAIIDDKEKPGCFEAMRTVEYYTPCTDYVAAPLIKQERETKVAFGVICLKISFLDVEQQTALQGIASGLSEALQVCEFRRKMTICGKTALESLMKRAPSIPSAYLSFFDVNEGQVCAQVVGQEMQGLRQGTAVLDAGPLKCAPIVSPLGGAPVGMMGGVISDDDGEAWATLSDCAATMGYVADVVSAEGLLADKTAGAWAVSEEQLVTHFKAARFHLVTEQTLKAVHLSAMDKIKSGPAAHAVEVRIVQAIMYILGHQQRDVSEWSKCRKLMTHHIFKEMRMIDVRTQLKVHKLKLAQECMRDVRREDMDKTGGQHCQMLAHWVRMMLQVQGLD